MATLALGITGGAIAGIVSGGNPGAIALGFNAGVIVGGLLFPPPGQDVGKLSDLKITGSDYGSVIPQAWGKVRLGSNIIWAKTDANGNVLVEHTSGGGGKGFPKSTRYTYTATFAVAICKGPITQINYIYADDLLIYDRTASPTSRFTIVPYYGDTSQTPSSIMEAVETNVPAYRELAYVVFENMDLTDFGNRIPNFSFEIEAPNNTVGGIASDIFTQCGLVDGTDYDSHYATQEVVGWRIESASDARSTLDELLRLYFTDLTEYDGMIIVAPRGTEPFVTIPYNDLGAKLDYNDPVPYITKKRMQDLELPQQIQLTYQDVDNLASDGSQGAMKYTNDYLQSTQRVGTALTLNATQARQIAEQILYTAWTERDTFETSLGPKYYEIAPASVLRIQLPNGDILCRVQNHTFPVFGPIGISLVRDASIHILNQNVDGAVTPGLALPLFAIVPTTFYAWSDIVVRDVDVTTTGFYVVGTGEAGWRGATIFYSTDGGTSYSSIGSFVHRGEFGACDTILGDGVDTISWDVINDVDVTLEITGELSSDSEANVLGNILINKALVGEEIIAYATATLIGALQYTLSDLRRGYLSTVFTGHVASERFIHLTDAVVRCILPSDLSGSTIKVKCVSPGQTLADVTAQDVTIL